MEEGRLVDRNSADAQQLQADLGVDLGAHSSQALCWQLLCLSGHCWVGMQAGVAGLESSSPPSFSWSPLGSALPQQNTCSS